MPTGEANGKKSRRNHALHSHVAHTHTDQQATPAHATEPALPSPTPEPGEMRAPSPACPEVRKDAAKGRRLAVSLSGWFIVATTFSWAQRAEARPAGSGSCF